MSAQDGSRFREGDGPTADCLRPTAPLWIFGYGSLMWRPDFAYEAAVHARVDGWRRGFFIYSTHHRGSHARPGLVLGLDRGGTCEGIAYLVPAAEAASTLAYLRAREQVNGVYREARVTARLVSPEASKEHVGNRSANEDARLLVGNRSANIKAITYVCERSHPSYTGRLPLAEQVRLIRGARGVSGCNLTYLINTVRHLEKLGVREPELERVMSLAGPHFTRMHGSVHLDRAARSLLACCLRWPVHVPLMRPSERRRFNHRKQIAQWSLP